MSCCCRRSARGCTGSEYTRMWTPSALPPTRSSSSTSYARGRGDAMRAVVTRHLLARLLHAGLCCGLVTAPAGAAPITYVYTGTLTSADPRLGPLITVGDTFSGSLTYDDSGVDLLPNTTNVYELGVTSHVAEIGSYRLSGSGVLAVQDEGAGS